MVARQRGQPASPVPRALLPSPSRVVVIVHLWGNQGAATLHVRICCRLGLQVTQEAVGDRGVGSVSAGKVRDGWLGGEKYVRRSEYYIGAVQFINSASFDKFPFRQHTSKFS
jgi:hypothetical protein